METERPKTDHGGEQPGTPNNVVPFPRDWLGPREELVPFGISAACEAEPGPAGPGAEAFWGGECDPLHAVVAAPAASAPIAGRRLQPLAGRLAIGGLVMTVLAMAVLGRIAGVPTAGSGPAVGSDVAAAGFFDLAQLRGAVGTPTIESPKPAVHAPVRPARSAAHARHRRRPATRTSGTRTSGTNSVAPASSSATSVAAAPPTSSQPVSSATSSSTASQPTETSSAPTHSSVSSHTDSSVSSHTATVRPGPVGPGAPFGPGQVK